MHMDANMHIMKSSCRSAAILMPAAWAGPLGRHLLRLRLTAPSFKDDDKALHQGASNTSEPVAS